MPTIVITGASRGIGREFARQYRNSGWRVIGTCRERASQDELDAEGIEAHLVELADLAAIERFSAALAALPIDLFIANAGIYEGKSTPLAEIGTDTLVRSFWVNALAPIVLAKRLRANLLASAERKLIAMTSSFATTATNNLPGHVAYRSSKAALNAAWKGIALEEPDLIAVAISPGHVKTRMTGFAGSLTAEESVSSMRRFIAGLTREHSGRQFGYDGSERPW
jgi:NAD(P)-dependent dehydrogenase (short-subunit alcohol dehydrogenase family)